MNKVIEVTNGSDTVKIYTVQTGGRDLYQVCSYHANKRQFMGIYWQVG